MNPYSVHCQVEISEETVLALVQHKSPSYLDPAGWELRDVVSLEYFLTSLTTLVHNLRLPMADNNCMLHKENTNENKC